MDLCILSTSVEIKDSTFIVHIGLSVSFVVRIEFLYMNVMKKRVRLKKSRLGFANPIGSKLKLGSLYKGITWFFLFSPSPKLP